MSALSVCLGRDARAAFCDAFDNARACIDAEFFSVNDPEVVASLNRAASRGVRVRVTIEGDTHRYGRGPVREPSDDEVRGSLDSSVDVIVSRQPNALVHGKAAVIDDCVALIATANANASGFSAPGEALVIDRNSADARSVASEIEAAASETPPSTQLRRQLGYLFRSPYDLRVASEDLSDPRIVAWLVHRARCGHHDRVLVGRAPSKSSKKELRKLVAAGVEVRTPLQGYMHEKFIDAGARLYVGSANLTHNGVDESHEVGIVADAADFADGAAALRADFDSRWATQTRSWTFA